MSLTKWVPSGMLSVLNTKLREEAEWWRLKLRATLKTLTVKEKERQGKEGETGLDQIKSRLCKRGLISPRTHTHTHTWSWWSHAPNT